MRAVIQALQRGMARSRTRSGAAPWGLAAGRGAADLAAAAGPAAAAAAAGEPSLREYLIYRWDTDTFQSYSVDIDSCGPSPMLLDVLLKVQAEQDPSLAIRYGCRRGGCGACAAVVNGVSLLPCNTPVNRAVAGVSKVKGLMPPIVPVAEKDCY